MTKMRLPLLIALAALLGAPAPPATPVQNLAAMSAAWPKPAGDFSVMTYNVKDLPWPIAADRKAAIGAIGQRLALMRSRGVQPDVVLLQEAFGEEAQAIGRTAGYAHTVTGPEHAGSTGPEPIGSDFAREGQLLKGEGMGSLINGGLVILSDFPILKVERHAFPQGACAGYDCLAAKGILIVWADIPGAAQPVAIVDTHLNSRGAAHVPQERADEAYRHQIAILRDMLKERIRPGTPVIIGGDFNTGNAATRRAAFFKPLLTGMGDGMLANLLHREKVDKSSIRETIGLIERNKDKLLSSDGAGVRFIAKRAWVPFGLRERNALSDHAGFVIDFDFAS